ncbi:class I mannose-6-phosphate isomerase [Demequina lignilytica]|uniref:Class I mannose-6-phosphate isomerase n=1 Tax=Demequina lignilytica TaxID=3051663 RepID=A0AB35MH76_9MICO|nr:class I mannose-6-phosphate isomerase [Demequina sp. SYSU T0a273]MDN4483164.1 class I mannose-6-phosphate isomerase [Demequina sp. SYSU T0a273]
MTTLTARATLLGANQPADRFYAGGERIAAFRGDGAARPHTPEDWVGSVTTLFGEASLGLTVLPDGTALADAVAADPVAWLGEEHVAAFGADTCLLVKLLDAGQRLPVHAHPDVPFAAEHLGLTHGKTEAWIFLEPADVHLGFTREVGEDELARWVSAQDTAAMLGAMHRLSVEAGDAVLVPAGTAHAIGEGAFLVELQEPTDLSILMEWDGFAIDGAAAGHLGLGFDRALRAVDRRALSREQVESLRTARARDGGSLLAAAAPFFRAERVRGDSVLAAGFSVLVCTAGAATLTSESGDSLDVRCGIMALLPHAAGAWSVTAGPGFEAIRCRPPSPADAV